MILNWEKGEEGIGVALLGILSFVFAERWACNPAFAYTEDWLFGRAPSPVDGNKLRIGQAVQLLRLFFKKKKFRDRRVYSDQPDDLTLSIATWGPKTPIIEWSEIGCSRSSGDI